MGTEAPGYGCQFPKDENRETEVSGFRFFVSGWGEMKKIKSNLVFYSLNRIFAASNKSVKIMTALQLNAELYRAMGEIADNEKLLAKVLAYVKGLVTTQQKGANATARNGWAAAAKQAHADGEDKLMAADVFEDETMEDWKW